MIRYHFLNIFLLFFTVFSGVCQENDYTFGYPLLSSGKVPSDFTTGFYETYITSKTENISANETRYVKKVKDEFLMSSAFYFRKILESGEVLFNDDITNFLNKIADTLLSFNPELRKQIRIYTVKSPYVNAFATDYGVIMINVGLIAQAENEAQIAFIIAHEIIHYLKRHSLNFYLEKEGIIKGAGGYTKYSENQRIFSYHFRSKEMESEADEMGYLEIYSKSQYNSEAPVTVLDILQYSDLPFDEIPFSKKIFEDSIFFLPSDYELSKPNPITTPEDYDDSKSTHPNIKKRRNAIREIIKLSSAEGKENFLIGKSKFLQIRNIARFETIRQQILNRDYLFALYNSYIMQRNNPENELLEINFVASLYYISKYKTNSSYSSVVKNYKKVEGQISSLSHILYQLSRNELNILALRMGWKLYKKYPTNKYLRKIIEDLFHDLSITNNIKKDFFVFKNSDENKIKSKNSNEDKESDTTELSKYDKIKKIRTENKKLINDGNFSYAFFAFSDDTSFNNLLNYFDDIRIMNRKKEDAYELLTFKEKQSVRKKAAKEKSKLSKSKVGIDTMIMMRPVFLKFDERKKEDLRIVDTYYGENELTELVKKMANDNNLTVSHMDISNIDSNGIEMYNEYSLLYEWLMEKMLHNDRAIIIYQSQYLRDIINKYKTKYLDFMLMGSVRMKKKIQPEALLYPILSVYLIPVSVVYLISNNNITFLYNNLYNIETGKQEMEYISYIDSRNREDFINSRLYDIIKRIKK